MEISQQPTTKIPVSVENFVRAETDNYFKKLISRVGIGNILHHREPFAIDKQDIIRTNRDTLYSTAVFDLNATPVTITFPKMGNRFCSLMVIDEDHFVHDVVYTPGEYTYTKEEIGTRYMFVAVRTFFDPNSDKDVDAVHIFQDQIHVSQKDKGKFEIPNWDQKSLSDVRNSLIQIGSKLTDVKKMFGKKEDVDSVKHLIGTAMGWGGNPEADAYYLSSTPTLNDGRIPYRLVVKDVPVEGFWSVTVYNSKGFLEKNERNLYSFNNFTAKKEKDGSVIIQFGGCNDQTPNCIPVVNGWNYTVRMYRPKKEILDGSWTFPEAQPMQ
jgi:hypothetical protein